jgi:hypothetical protein|tara:strand:- start:50 stop:889 length:840 start_codon:yes stop_codon:yes gene_type:complete
MEVNLVVVTGIDPILLYHYIKHYKQLGVDNFYIVIWGDSKDVKYDETIAVLNDYNLEVYKDYRNLRTGDAQFLTDIYNEVISTKPDNWWIQADHDEFIILDKPLKEFIDKDLIYNNMDFVYGIMLDRIGEGGEFSKLTYDDNDIWKKFPNVGFISNVIRENDVRGVPILKGNNILNLGQHSVHPYIFIEEWKFKILEFPPKIQIHHFKWRREDIDMHAKYSLFGESWWSHENEKVYNYMTENQRIDITDPRFLIKRCSNNKFDSYSKWEDVIKLVIHGK